VRSELNRSEEKFVGMRNSGDHLSVMIKSLHLVNDVSNGAFAGESNISHHDPKDVEQVAIHAPLTRTLVLAVIRLAHGVIEFVGSVLRGSEERIEDVEYLIEEWIHRSVVRRAV
jgi:hypothetical protein